jgi:hypothetical protein
MYGDTTKDYLLYSPLSRDTTTDYPIYPLSALICMAIQQTTICCALLRLAILQATIQSTDFPLYHLLSNLLTTNDYLLYSTLSQDTTSDYPIYRLSALIVRRCYKRLSAVLSSGSRYYHRLSNLPTIRFDMYRDATNAYLLYSPPSRDTPSDYPIYLLSALPPTIQSTDYKRLSAVLYSFSGYYKRLSNLPTIRSDL